MSYISCDVEADGPIPHKYSMVCFGAVIVEPSLSKTFYGQTAPVSDNYIPDALAISGFTREQHLKFDDPKSVMSKFHTWINEYSTPPHVLISDNNGFDAAWMNFYFHYFLNMNPFGFSSRRIGDVYCGMKMNMSLNSEWKKLREVKHDHNPVNDAIGNAIVILKMEKMGLRFPTNALI